MRHKETVKLPCVVNVLLTKTATVSKQTIIPQDFFLSYKCAAIRQFRKRKNKPTRNGGSVATRGVYNLKRSDQTVVNYKPNKQCRLKYPAEYKFGSTRTICQPVTKLSKWLASEWAANTELALSIKSLTKQFIKHNAIKIFDSFIWS